MLIEPCCCTKQLPPYLQKNIDNICIFATSGDVTVEHFIHAVAHLAGPNMRMLMVQNHYDAATRRYIDHCKARGWFKNITVACATTDTKASLTIGDGTNEVSILTHPMLTDGLLLLRGEKRSILIQGLMTTDIQAGRRLYTAVYCTEPAQQLLDPFLTPIQPLLKLAKRV